MKNKIIIKFSVLGLLEVKIVVKPIIKAENMV